MSDQQHGIYILRNIHNNKVYIGATNNIHTYKDTIISLYNNKRIQNTWKIDSGTFEFEILEIVDSPDALQERREYWVKYYQSNNPEYGYNLELKNNIASANKPPQNLTIQELLSYIVSKLDYNLEFAEDRLNHVNKLLDRDTMNCLIDYISSPLFCEKQIKNKNSYLTENDIVLIGFSFIVDYLVFPKYKNKQEKRIKENEKYPVRKKKSSVNMDFRRNNEKLFGNKSEIERLNSSFQRKYKNNITDDDLKKYPEIQDLYNTIRYIEKRLGIGLEKEQQKKVQNEFIKKYGNKQFAYTKRMLRDLKKEIIVVKECLSKTINIKNALKGTTVFNYDEDTGYIDKDGEYKLVSKNKIDFSQERHILELLNHYSLLKQSYSDDPTNDMWVILFDLEQLIEKTNFSPHLKDILIMKIDGYSAEEIIKELKQKYKLTITEDRLSRIYNKVIPKKIVETYLQEVEDWTYTFLFKGTYKTCSKCNEVKLLNEKHFGKKADSKDGFHTICKKCRRLYKNDQFLSL